MKKWVYLVSGIIIGAFVATTGSALADQVKSLVGKKVTAEYDVVVNGKILQAKGAVIDGKANVPVRPMAEAIGVDVKVEGRKIVMQTLKQEKDDSSADTTTKPTPGGNKYMGDTKEGLKDLKNSIENRLKHLIEGREGISEDIREFKEGLKEHVARGFAETQLPAKIADREKDLAGYDKMIAEDTEELHLVNEALEARNKQNK